MTFEDAVKEFRTTYSRDILSYYGFSDTRKKYRSVEPETHSNGDKTPSMGIFVNGNTYKLKDFAGSNKSYSAIDLVMAEEGLTFKNAVYKCGEICQISINEHESKTQNKRMSKQKYYHEKNCQDKYPYYRIDNGEETHIKYRLPPKDKHKQMKQGYDDNNGVWHGTLKDIDTSLSIFCNVSIERLKKTASEGKIICYAEGEKDCKTLLKYGYPCFTFGSVNDNKDEVFKYLRDAQLVIFGDNDASGINSANRKQKYFSEIGGKAVVIIPSTEDKGDITDYMLCHTKEELQELINNALSQEIEKASEEVDLSQFHLYAETGKTNGVYHYKIFEYIKQNYNLFIVGSTPYIYQNGVYLADTTGAKLKTIIRSLIYPQFIKSTTISNIYALFLQDIELQKNFEELNNYPSYWICFKNGMFDTKEKRLLPHNAKYLAINQIPHNYYPERNYKGDKIEDFLNFICEDADSKEMLLEYIGYCLTKDTSQQKFLILNGEGGTGKSTLIRCIEALVGSANISNIALSDLQQRFASFGLMGRLLNSCADLEISALEDTSILKKILGEDNLRGEQKGHDAISFKSYSKLLFSVNEMPLIRQEKTNGFYRRLLVLTMDKQPLQKNPHLFEELSEQIDYLLQISVQALERMYENKLITVSKASEKAVERLRADSDTVEAFLLECCFKDEKSKIDRTDLYKKYFDYCEDAERQALTKNNFYKSLRVKGFKEYTSHGVRYFGCINYLKNCTQDAQKNAPNGFIPLQETDFDELPFK